MNEIVKDLVSVITPCYNSSDYISDAIDSVINQEYKKWCLIKIIEIYNDNIKFHGNQNTWCKLKKNFSD